MTKVLNLFSCMFVSTTTPFSCSYFSLRLLLPSFTDTLHLAIHAFLSYHHYFITLDHQLFPMINAAGLLVVLWHMTLVVFWSLQYCWNPTSSYLVHSFLWLCYLIYFCRALIPLYGIILLWPFWCSQSLRIIGILKVSEFDTVSWWYSVKLHLSQWWIHWICVE